uniref:G-protein coupled receptors family 1 profile domain-containing protein n=1 Tax=Astyanax mexicanus TaxID=7994 RepID=A0A3B1JK04_ASTMX
MTIYFFYYIYPKEAQTVLYLLLATIAFLTFLGNLLVIITVIHFKQLHTPTNYLILSLAVADLLTCWYLGNIFCKIHSSLDVTLCTASILNLKMTPNATLLMIFVCWTISGFVGFGMIFLELGILGVEDFYYSNVACEGGCFLFVSKTASAVFTMLCFYIPAVVMISLYLKIFHIAKRQARLIQNAQILSSQRHTSVGRTEIKATKTLAIVVGVFLLFWTPYFICALIDPIIGHVVPSFLFDFFAWVGYSNSTCNPIVYALFYIWFRKSFRIILLGKIFKPNSSRIKLF